VFGRLCQCSNDAGQQSALLCKHQLHTRTAALLGAALLTAQSADRVCARLLHACVCMGPIRSVVLWVDRSVGWLVCSLPPSTMHAAIRYAADSLAFLPFDRSILRRRIR
jgi:hypothetical protein